MKNKERFILYDNNNEFEYTKNKSDINFKSIEKLNRLTEMNHFPTL